MKILGLSHPVSGCGFHRITLPLGFMDDIDGIVTNYPNEEILSNKYDIVFYNRISPFDKSFEQVRDKLGCKIILDMDDDWDLPSNHLNYHDYQEMSARIISNMRNADMVTCTHERLAEKISKYNKNVQVFTNAIPFGEHQFTEEKEEDEKIRIFWCGGITHEGDLEILKNPIRRLKSHKNKIKMILGGYNDENNLSKFIWDKMFSYFTCSGQLEHEVLKGMTPDKYMEMYKKADIMLIPLLASDWSANKSNLKILEASVKSVAVICQAVAPYYDTPDAPVLWVHNQKDWYEHLNFLINNKEARIEYGKKINQWAREKYNLFNVNIARRKAFADLVAAQTHL